MESPDADSDLLAAMLKDFAEALMSAEASAQCQAAYNERTDERTNSRNGYRTRRWDTRAGTIDLAVPKLRADTYYPDWLLTHRKRSEQALASVIAQSYVGGVSTRRVEDLAKAMGIDSLSPSQVSRLAADLDAKVAAFRERPLDAGPYRYGWIDALVHKVREGGRVVNVSTVIATAVNVEGRREVIGFDVVTSESTASWTGFLQGLVARGLSGVELVISDAHGGIKAAIGQVLTGVMATMPHTFHGEPVEQGDEGVVADGRCVGAVDLRATRPGLDVGPARRRGRQAHRGRVRRCRRAGP